MHYRNVRYSDYILSLAHYNWSKYNPLAKMLSSCPAGITEFICHIGLEKDKNKFDRFNMLHCKEANLLLTNDINALAELYGIELTNFRTLSNLEH